MQSRDCGVLCPYIAQPRAIDTTTLGVENPPHKFPRHYEPAVGHCSSLCRVRHMRTTGPLHACSRLAVCTYHSPKKWRAATGSKLGLWVPCPWLSCVPQTRQSNACIVGHFPLASRSPQMPQLWVLNVRLENPRFILDQQSSIVLHFLRLWHVRTQK